MNTTTRNYTQRIAQYGDAPTRVSAHEAPLNNSDVLTERTVERMREIITRTAKDPVVRAAVDAAYSPELRAGTLNAKSSRQERAAVLFAWIANQVEFVDDDLQLRDALDCHDAQELLIEPPRLLTMPRPQGDCDDFTMLGCAMCLCAGVPAEIVTIAADGNDPNRWSHVYYQAQLDDGRLLPQDIAECVKHNKPFGWEAPQYYARKDWGLMFPTTGLNGLGFLPAGAEPSASLPGLTPNVNSGSWWQDLVKVGGNIANARYGTPPEGTYVQTAQGVYSRGVPGAVPGQFPGQGLNVSLGTGGNNSGMLIIAALGIGALVLLSKRS